MTLAEFGSRMLRGVVGDGTTEGKKARYTKGSDSMKDQDTHVKAFFDQSVYWQGDLYKAPDNLLAKAVIRRKIYAMQMVNELADLKIGTALDVGCGSGVYVA